MARSRGGRTFRVLALLTLATLPLAACSSAVSPDVSPPTGPAPQSDKSPLKERELTPQDRDPDGSEGEALEREDGSTPRHDATPPRYEPEPLWPASGPLEFPGRLGPFDHSSQTSEYSNFVTTIYTDTNYQILSVTVGSDYFGYNSRLENYDNLQYSGAAVCGTDNTQSNSEIAWTTCFMVGSDGYVAVTAYATSKVDMTELAGYAEDLYRALTDNAS